MKMAMAVFVRKQEERRGSTGDVMSSMRNVWMYVSKLISTISDVLISEHASQISESR